MGRCPNDATHVAFVESLGRVLMCETCVKKDHLRPYKTRKRWLNWTQEMKNKQCECEHIQHG